MAAKPMGSVLHCIIKPGHSLPCPAPGPAKRSLQSHPYFTICLAWALCSPYCLAAVPSSSSRVLEL